MHAFSYCGGGIYTKESLPSPLVSSIPVTFYDKPYSYFVHLCCVIKVAFTLRQSALVTFSD